MGVTREQKFWGLLNGTQTVEQNTISDTYQESSRADKFWSSLGKERYSAPSSASIATINLPGNRVGSSSLQNQWMRKYQGKGYRSLASTIDTMEDGAEKEWLKSYAQQVDYDEKRNLDIGSYEKEIQALEQKMKDYDPDIDWTNPTDRKKFDAEMEAMQADIDKRKNYLTLAKRIQEQAAGEKKYSQIAKKSDFAAKSGFDSSNQEIGYQYVNADAAGRLDMEEKYGDYVKQFADHAWDSMDEYEQSVYNYLMNSGDREGAAEYLKNIEEEVQMRKATETDAYIDKLVEKDPRAKVARYAYMANVGYDQHKTGMRDFGNLLAGNDEYTPATATQYAGQMVREDLGSDGIQLPSWLGGGSTGQMLGDVISTTANMAPSMAIGLLNPTAGSVAMGASAAGNAYREALNEGYDVNQARGYGILAGASEIIMEKLLGGISAFGGNALGKYFTRNMKNADTALKRIAKEIGGSMLSEFGEEYLQEVLTPFFRNLTLGTDDEVKPFSVEALYSGILGAITGGVLEGPSAIARGIQPDSQAAVVSENGKSALTTELANSEEAASDNLGAVTEKSSAVGDKMKATEVGAENAHTNVGVSKMENIQRTDDLDSFAQQFGTQADDVRRTFMEDQDLQEFEVGFQNAYAMGLDGGKQEVLGSVPYLSKSQREVAFILGRDAAAAQKADEPKKAVVSARLTNEEGIQDVTIAEVVDMDDNTMTFRLEDGSTVTDEELEFPDGAEVYSTVMELGMDLDSANAVIKASTESDQPRDVVAAGIEAAYRHGKYGYGMEALLKNQEAAGLPESVLKESYLAGEKYRKQSREMAQNAENMGSGKIASEVQKGKVHFSGNADELNNVQRESLTGLEWIADLTGAQIYVEDIEGNKHLSRINGRYDPADDSIHIDLRAGSDGAGTLLYTAGHEFTHRMKRNNEAAFFRLADFLISEYGKKGVNTDALVKQQMADAAADGIELTYDEAFEEMVADAMEAMFTDTDALAKMEKLKAQDKSLWQEIKDFVLGLAEKIRAAYAKLKPDSAEARYVLQMKESIDQMAQLFAEGVMAEKTEGNDSGNYKVKYSFAGRSAANADVSALQQAEKLADQGIDNEVIRQRTGWYKGMDGKWRFEIDDSQIKLADNIINYMSLGELIQHEKLFEAYPDLADISIVFQGLGKGVNGSYDPQFDSINLSYRLKNDPIGLKDALVHEIQHAIQHREGFTSGATVAKWERKIKAGFDTRRAEDIREAQETERELRRIQKEEPEFYRDMLELDAMAPDLPRGAVDWETLEKLEDDPIEWQRYDARREELEEKYGDIKVWDMNHLLYQQEKATKNMGRSAEELYYNTAGEIEARDVSNRLSKTAEQRKNSPPRLGNEDTVFADGNALSQDYIPGDVSDSELEIGINNVAEMSPISAISGKEFTTEGRTLLDDVDRFFKSVGGQVYNSRLGDINLTRRGVKDSLAHGMTPQKASAFAAIPDVLREGKVVGFEKNWKGRGYDSATIAAPVIIGGEEYLMAVIVHRSNSANRFYVHDVFAAKKEATPFMTGTQNLGEPGGATSTISIIKKILSVKANQTESGKKDSLRKKLDRQYLDAVNRGDMRTAEKLVEEAAKQWGAFLNNSEANEVFPQSGEVRTFYHGTNTGDFTVFDKGLLGNSSGDLGWFGKGFYFAFSADEANAYGGRVIRAYLKMKNPYDYSQLYKFKGSDRSVSQYARFAWVYNIVRQFPDIVTDQKVYAYPNDSDNGKAVSWKQLAGWMDRIEKDAKFSVAKVELSNGDTAWELRANPKQESFTNEDGETFTWTEYGMRQLFATEMDAKEPINQIGAYLVNVMGVESIPRRSIERIDFSGAVQRAGYDGIIQSPSGDEAVVFDSSQIKLSDPVTYDDSGNIIPISKRFDNSNPDIRYSRRKKMETETLQEQNRKLQEDVERLNELVKLQGKVTHGAVFKHGSVEAAAKYLKKLFHTDGDTKELAQLLDGFYKYIASDKVLTWEGVKEQAAPIVSWLQENEKFQRDRYAQTILDTLKGQSFYLDETQLGEVKSQYGNVSNYRRAVKNMASSKSSQSLDQLWQELSGQYPDIFSPDTSAADMPTAFAEAIDRLESMGSTESAMDWRMKDQAMMEAVYDSYWRVDALETVADRNRKKINEIRGKHYAKMTELRRDRDQKLKELQSEKIKALEKYREKRKESVARKDARRKIRKTVFELDKLLNRGDKKKNVKSGMTSMVDSVLKLADALFMDEYTNRDMLRNGVGVELTDAEEKLFQEAQQILQQAESGAAIEGMEFTSEVDAMEQLKKLDQKLISKMAGLKDVFARERKRLYGTTVSDLLGKLADEYSRLSEAEDGAVRAAKDENVYAHLLQLQKDVGGTTVQDMTLGQMEAVADAFTMVLTTVRNANKMFAKNLKFKRDTLAGMVMGEIGAAVKKVSKLIRPGKNAIDSFSWNNLKPVYAFERLGSETLKTLYQNIRGGQDVWSRDMQEADAFRREQYKKHNRKAWNMEKQHRFEFESGIVELNLEQIMSLYAYSRREQALDHLLKGGFVFSGSTEVMVKEHGIQRRYLKKDATAYNLTADELLQVVETLTKEQKDFVEEMQTYLSDVMGGKGNEISLQMYGIKSYGEKNYFPIRSAGQYMERAKEDSFRKEQGQISIVNSGFTKNTTPKANNPITLDGFMNVWADHVNEMSMYHGFALPMEDFRRVYNYSSPNMEVGNSQSVNAAIENAFGKAATNYIDQLFKDLNGGAVSDNRENLSKKLVGLHKKAAVFASASVVVQQPSAIVRAFALIDPTHFVGPKVDQKRHKQLWEEIKKYAPVAFVKEMGYFDTGMGRSARDFLQAEEYTGIREKMVALFKDADYRDEFLGKAPALSDEITWCSIWEAVKRETKSRNYGMDVRSDEFLKIAGERFSEIIDKTQVYDSVLSRSANMRSKSLHMNMLTSFLAEPTTSINMLEDALRKGDRKQMKRTVGAVYGSVLLNSLLVSLVYAARDDDEDETFWEKYLSSVAVEMLDGLNPITYYPFLKDIWSIGQGFDVERSDMSLITDFADAAKKVVGGIQAVTSAEEGEEESAMAQLKDSLWGMVDTIANLTGLPVKNVRRDIEAARNVVSTISTDRAGRMTTRLSLKDAVLAEVMNAIPIGGLFYEKSKRDRLYGAIVAKDKSYVDRLKAGYVTDESYHSAIRLALRDHDSRIWEAAVAWNNNDLKGYMALAREIIAEGNFIQDDVVLAIRAEASAMEESESASSSTAKGYFNNEKFGVAMGQNNTSMADAIRKDLIDTKVANGKTRSEAEEAVESTARSQLKELYELGEISGTVAQAMLVRYGGYDQQKASDKVSEWKYGKDNPELDGRITYTQYKRWEADGKSRGVPLETYTKVAEYRGGDTSSGTRSQEDVAAYINSMPISTAQKDALWCCFWSEKTLYKNAPWH